MHFGVTAGTRLRFGSLWISKKKMNIKMDISNKDVMKKNHKEKKDKRERHTLAHAAQQQPLARPPHAPNKKKICGKQLSV